jgi:spore maturation protein CgeB
LPHYNDVCFSTKEELIQKVEYFVTHERDRVAIAQEMCQSIRQTYSYGNGTRRMLDFVASRLRECPEAS